MKRFFRIILHVIMCSMTFHAAANRPGEGTRIDFLNSEGVRVESKIIDYESYDYILFSIGKFGDAEKWSMFHSWNPTCMAKFVPWGEESYQMTVKIEPYQNIQVSKEIIKGEATRSSDDVLCGSLVRFTIKVPDNKYPVVSVLNEYTDVRDDYPYWFKVQSLGLNNLVDELSVADILNMNYRERVIDNIESTGLFKRDEENPNVWYIDITMPNEPITLNFNTEKPTNTLLNAARLRVLQNLYCQHQSLNLSPGNCGEPFVMSWVGDYLSDDMISAQFARSSMTASVYDFTDSNKKYTNIPWVNNFLLIASANLLIDNLDDFDVTDKEREIAKAQMLTLRSHAYWRILQCYGDRWQDSDNGSTLCAPLETTFNTENLPLSSMLEIADNCYAALQEAISIFSKYDYERTEIVEPDLDVAQGVLMRVALLREDWQTAASMAENILANIPLTTNEQLMNGFFTPEPSWIWGAWNNFEVPGFFYSSVYYWSNLTSDACNGHYCASWNMGTNAVSKDFYDSTNQKDIRRSFYVMPDRFDGDISNAGWWYNSDNIQSTTGIWVMQNLITPIYDYFSSRSPEEVVFPAFCNNSRSIRIPFGGHTKFYQPGFSAWSDAAVSFMRSDEVLLTLAEAYYHLGQESKARESLMKLNSMRIEDYSINLTGEELLKEIRLSRKIELWGEGHSWFDMKRWKLPLIKRAWVSGDIESGNWPDKLAGDVKPYEANGWRFAIPSLAIQNNPLINMDSAPMVNSGSMNKVAIPQKSVNNYAEDTESMEEMDEMGIDVINN